MIKKVNVNYEKASKIWGGVYPGYYVTRKEVESVRDNENGDYEITLIPIGSNYEIDDVKSLSP